MLAIQRETDYIGEEEEEADDDEEISDADPETSVNDRYHAGFDTDVLYEELRDE